MFKCVDLIGPIPTLYMDSKSRFQTNVGASLTIILVILSFLCFAAFGRDMLMKSNPTMYQLNKFNMTNEIRFEEIPFSIGLMKIGGYPIKDLSRKLEFRFIYAITNTSDIENPTKFIKYDLVQCSKTKIFEKNYLDINSKLIGDPVNFFCLPDFSNLTLFGQFGNPEFKIGRMYVSQCQNSTTKNDCYPLNEIQEDLREFYVQYTFLDRYYDLSDYKEPLKIFWKSDLIQLSAFSSRSDQYTYKILNIESDDGFILESNKNILTSQFDTKMVLTMGYNPDYFVLVTDVSNISSVAGRKYSKIQNVLANTGGFIKFVMMVFTTLNNFLVKYLFAEKIYFKSLSKYMDFYQNFNSKHFKDINKSLEIHTTVSKLLRNNLVTNKITTKQKPKLNLRNILPPKPLRCRSFICIETNKFRLMNKINNIFKKEMDAVELFYLTQKFKFAEKIIFGKEEKKWKNILVHWNIIELGSMKTNYDKKQILHNKKNSNTLDKLLTEKRTLDTNSLIINELKQALVLIEDSNENRLETPHYKACSH